MRVSTLGFKSMCGNSCVKRFCSVGLQADTVDSRTCPPEGGRYTKQNRATVQVLETRGIPFLIESCYWRR
jgi:hypothetical protein